MGQNLYEKVFDRHAVRRLTSGQHQLLMGLHLVHEVTSPQAFSMLRERGLGVAHPERTFATVDHIIPTHDQRTMGGACAPTASHLRWASTARQAAQPDSQRATPDEMMVKTREAKSV